MAKENKQPDAPEPKKEPEPTLSPLQPRRAGMPPGAIPFPKLMGFEVQIHEHKLKKMPWLIEGLSIVMLVVIFIVAMALANDPDATFWVSTLGNIAFMCIVYAGAIAIYKNVLDSHEKEHTHQRSEGEVPKEIMDMIKGIKQPH